MPSIFNELLLIGEEEGVGLPISSSMSRGEKVKALQSYLQDLEQEINTETESLKVCEIDHLFEVNPSTNISFLITYRFWKSLFHLCLLMKIN